MAIMSRVKKAKGRTWAQTNEARAKANTSEKQVEIKEITEEEHQKRLDKLKACGLI